MDNTADIKDPAAGKQAEDLPEEFWAQEEGWSQEALDNMPTCKARLVVDVSNHDIFIQSRDNFGNIIKSVSLKDSGLELFTACVQLADHMQYGTELEIVQDPGFWD